MIDTEFEQLLEAVQKLTPKQKSLLAASLMLPQPADQLSRAALIAELEALRNARAFVGVESLRNRYTNQSISLTDKALSATIHDVANAWETELDEFFGDAS